MHQSSTLDIGMDVHTDTSAVAYVAKDHDAEVCSLGTLGTRQGDMDQLIRTRPSKATQLSFVYEAGPCGSWLDRYLRKKGDDCWGVAPCLMPKKAGDRGQTARREAVQLARLMRSGALTPVDVPKAAGEALRDRTRAREDALRALKAATFRLKAFLLRHDLRDTDQANGGPAHLRWLAAVVCHTPAQQLVLQDYGRAVNEHTARLGRLEPALQDQAQSWRVHPVVAALQALRGVQRIVAVTPVAARGDLTRVDTPRPLMQCLGLLAAAYSSGERRRQGSLPTAGHTQARRALVEGAWAYRSPAYVSRHLPRRLEPQPKTIQDLSWKAPVRRCTRVRCLMARGQHANHVVGAMARALVGLMWALAQQVPVTREVPQTERPWMNRVYVRTSRSRDSCRDDACQCVGVSR